MKIWKNLLGFFVYSATIGVVGFALAFWWAADQFAAPGPLGEKIYFEVERGQGVITIAQNLKSANAVDNPYIFVFGTRLLNAQSDLKAGEYEIDAGASPRAIMEKMRKGDTFKRRVTVREGLTNYEVYKLLGNVKDIEPDAIPNIPDGYLLPGTYDYKRGEKWSNIINRMQSDMRRELMRQCGYLEDMLDWDAIDKMTFEQYASYPCPEDVESKKFDGMDPTIKNVLILASIIEKETGVDSERRRVAGVFVNRLRLGMPLQTDPTVIYALTNGRPQDNGQGPLGRRLLSRDLEIDSPYNTYKYSGLPPGPICNPGKASIEAALNPEIHDYIFFVADGTGGHAFARTLDEHNTNVQKWRAVRQQ